MVGGRKELLERGNEGGGPMGDEKDENEVREIARRTVSWVSALEIVDER
jgi:hypothetical protein